MKLKHFVSVLFVVLLFGCSSKYTYNVDPTPLKEGKTRYYLDEVKVILKFSHMKPAVEEYDNQEQVTESFKKALIKNLNERDILSEDKDSSDFFVKVFITYIRNYTYAKTLTVPGVSFTFDVFDKNGVKLAHYGTPTFQPSYGTLGDMAVAAKVLSNNWGKEGELKDINQISKTIAYDLAGLGN